MDHSSSAPSSSLDESDEPLTPQRSPSRLDFCLEPLEEGDLSMHGMDWSSTSFHEDYPYTFVEGDPFAADIAPPAFPCLLIVEEPQDPPHATDSHAHEDIDTLPLFFAPSDQGPMDEVVIELQAPTPVHPPSVQMQADTQDSMPPSRVAPPRLNYPHHGFSRSALLQQKTLWNSRHEEWVEWQSRLDQGETQKQESDTDDAYTGLASPRQCIAVTPPPYMRAPPSGLERDLVNQQPRKREQDVHASIYPRVGDIAALRDPYSVNIDRSFFRLPLWTLHKALYAVNMQQRSASVAQFAPAYNVDFVQASTSSSTSSSYSSSTSGDDEESDSTLVADDSPVPKGQPLLEPLRSASPPQGPPSWNGFGGWEFSWYARWKLLRGIFRCDHAKYDTSGHPIREDENHNKNDEEEDYGMPLTDSSFSVDFDEECERAQAFYNRELKLSKVTL